MRLPLLFALVLTLFAGTLLAESRLAEGSGDRLPEAEAPDGERGFGQGLDPAVLAKVFRDPEPVDQEFLEGLWALCRDVEVLGSIAAARYERLGYFSLVDEASAVLTGDLEALHDGFRANERRAFKIPLGEERGLALARAQADPYFHARIKVVQGTEYDLQQLRRALNVLVVNAHGKAHLESGSELDALTWRADLAAARLRAAAADLEELYQPAVSTRTPDSSEVLRLARGYARGSNEGVEEIERELRVVTRDAEHALLEEGRLTEFDIAHHEALMKRYEDTVKAYKRLTEIAKILPFRPDGTLPTGMEGSLSDRYHDAAQASLEGCRLDPLVPELQYMQGLSVDFQSRQFSERRFDRFLALNGIRHWDHHTYAKRALSQQELWSLFVVSGWKPEDG